MVAHNLVLQRRIGLGIHLVKGGAKDGNRAAASSQYCLMSRGINALRQSADDHHGTLTQPCGKLAGACEALGRGLPGAHNSDARAMVQYLWISCHEECRGRMLLLHVIEWSEEIYRSKRSAWDRRQW
jgi:hypothetical protein